MTSYSDCSNCPFRGGTKVKSAGNPATCKYVLVGEAPGYNETRTGKPFVGKTGRLLSQFFARRGLDLHGDDFYLANALSCAVKDKKKTAEAINCCRPRILNEVRQLLSREDPPTLVLMGNHAKLAFFPQDTRGILASRGWREWEYLDELELEPVQDESPEALAVRLLKGHNIYIMTHPSYYIYNPNQAPMLVKDVNRILRGRLPQVGPFVLGYQGSLPYRAVIINSRDDLLSFLRRLKGVPLVQRGYLAFDIETDQVDWQRDRILCLSISTSPGRAYIIPDNVLYLTSYRHITTDWSKQKVKAFLADERYKSGSYLRPDPQIVALLNQIFQLPGYKWTGHNAKFDLKFLVGQLGVTRAHCDFDTLLAHYVLDERRGGHGLKALADDYFDTGDYEHGLATYLGSKAGRWSRIPRDVLYRYNAMDTECTLRLQAVLETELKEQGLYEDPFQNILMKAAPMLQAAELKGVLIDWEENYRIEKEELLPEVQKLEGELRTLAGKPELNPNSSKQIIHLLFDVFKFPEIEARTRAGGHKVTGRTSQKAMLDAWEAKGARGEIKMPEESWQFLSKLQEYRHLKKLLGSYIVKWRKNRGIDDRVHTTFQLWGTVTGRLSSVDPPLQTIPSKITDRWGPLVANMHVPAPGNCFLYADYSQAELMIAAGMSNDKFMIATFQKDGADYHSEVAEMAFGKDFTRDERQEGKKLTFGWLYGGQVRAIALDALQFTPEVADHFAHRWDEMFEGVVRWRKEQQEKMMSEGYVESIFGRRRRSILLTDKNVGKAKRVAVNSPIQSAASDFTLLSAVSLWERYKNNPDVNVVLLIHDSLVLEVREDLADEVAKVMEETMLTLPKKYFPTIPFQAKVKKGYRLGDLT